MTLRDEIIYNKEYVVILPTMSIQYKKYFDYSFGNVVVFDNLKDIDVFNRFMKINNFKQYIFVDYQIEYFDIIESLDINEKEIKFIFTKSLGELSNEFNYYLFNSIMKLYSSNKIVSIGFLDKFLYDSFKNKKISCYYIKLDSPKIINNTILPKSKTIGLINCEENPCHSFYNELSAIKLNGKYICKVLNPGKNTKNFLKLFNIRNIKCKNEEELIKDNVVNLYINFTANEDFYFIYSMDLGIPCILGNNSILINNKKLKDMLMIKSDDNIDEIKNKINEVIKNKKEIMAEYSKFRAEYSKSSKKSISDFLNIRKKEEITYKYEKLLSIVVPVYNTEKYLEKCLQSILKALPKSLKNKTEILIINDGSTDNSEKIALRFKEKYPNLIKYIKQKNHGLGNVRNVGLKISEGKYIASIDSDDTINSNFFKEALDSMLNGVDVIICDWLSVTNDSKFETPAIEWIFNDINTYEGLLYTTIMPSTCNKIIKKSLYRELNIKFLEDKYEDLSTNPFIMLKARSIKYIKKPYYEYYIRSNSIMRSSAGYSMINVLKVVNDRLEKYEKYVNIDLEKFKFYTFSWRMEEFIFNQLYTIDEKDINEFIKKIYSIKNIITDIFNNKYYLKMISNLNDENLKSFIIKRNEAFFKETKFTIFIKKTRENKSIYKLNAPIIYFGDKK